MPVSLSEFAQNATALRHRLFSWHSPPSWCYPQLKVIQGHWQWCHSIRDIRFPISVSLQQCFYLAPFTRYYHLFPKI